MHKNERRNEYVVKRGEKIIFILKIKRLIRVFAQKGRARFTVYIRRIYVYGMFKYRPSDVETLSYTVFSPYFLGFFFFFLEFSRPYICIIYTRLSRYLRRGLPSRNVFFLFILFFSYS